MLIQFQNRNVDISIQESQKIVLSDRECEVLYYLIKGKTAKETAKNLQISPRTVEKYIEQLKSKTRSRRKLEILIKINIAEFVVKFEAGENA